MIVDYKQDVENDLNKICKEIIESIDKQLLPNAEEKDAKVFYYKMKGDYYRYMAEYTQDEATKADIADKADEAYTKAMDIAKDLKTTNPIRLGLALNYSVFFYEIRDDSKKACDLAKTAFDDAIADIEHISEANYKDSTTIMQLMRDNLTLWTSEMDEGEDNDDK